jgi:hypothetical protein
VSASAASVTATSNAPKLTLGPTAGLASVIATAFTASTQAPPGKQGETAPSDVKAKTSPHQTRRGITAPT